MGEVRTVTRGLRSAAAELDSELEPESPQTTVLGAAEIFAPLPPVNWLCQPLDLAPGAPVLVAGYGFSGKTLAAQDLALAVATGTMAWGRFPVRAGRVLHVDFEQGSYLTRLRYQRLALARGVGPEDLADRLALAPFPGWYLDGDGNDELARLCDGVDLLVVDSFRAACPRTDENSSEARIPLDRLNRIAETTGTTPVVIHHARKPNQNAQGGARMSVRGSGALYDACGSVLVFAGEKGDPPTVSHEKARISGRPHPDFRLCIEDVDVDGTPSAGLRVSCVDTETSTKPAPSERLEEIKGEIVRMLTTDGTARSRESIRERLGKKASTVRAAVSELVGAGVLVEVGNTSAKRLCLAGRELSE